MQIKISDISSAFYNNKITISTDKDINRTFSQSVHSMSLITDRYQLVAFIALTVGWAAGRTSGL